MDGRKKESLSGRHCEGSPPQTQARPWLELRRGAAGGVRSSLPGGRRRRGCSSARLPNESVVCAGWVAEEPHHLPACLVPGFILALPGSPVSSPPFLTVASVAAPSLTPSNCTVAYLAHTTDVSSCPRCHFAGYGKGNWWRNLSFQGRCVFQVGEPSPPPSPLLMLLSPAWLWLSEMARRCDAMRCAARWGQGGSFGFWLGSPVVIRNLMLVCCVACGLRVGGFVGSGERESGVGSLGSWLWCFGE